MCVRIMIIVWYFRYYSFSFLLQNLLAMLERKEIPGEINKYYNVLVIYICTYTYEEQLEQFKGSELVVFPKLEKYWPSVFARLSRDLLRN